MDRGPRSERDIGETAAGEVAAAPLCLCIQVRAAAQALTKHYDGALEPAGVTVTQLSQLNTIAQQEAPPTLKALAGFTGLDRSTLGRNLRLLEEQGLVRMAAGEDARTREVSLTARGRAALKRGAPLWARAQRELEDRIGSDGRRQLTQLLDTLSA